MKIKRIAKRTIPLCFLPSEKLICYKDGHLLVYNNGEVCNDIFIFNDFKERILGKNRFLSRLMRLGIRSAIAIDDDHVILSKGHSLYEFCLADGSLSQGFKTPNSSRPLIFTEVQSIIGFKDGIYFGEYLMNMDKTPVGIYHRIGVDRWEKVFSFSQGEVNHIHNIIPDPYRNCLWIFTGDFGEAAAIWKASDNFKEVKRVAFNNQMFRACVAYVLPEGILYATDTPFAKDFIYLFKTETGKVKEVFPIHGSCIYGCKWKDKFVFSSTVESDGLERNRWELLFTRKRGAGIKDDYVHLYMGNLHNGFKEIYKEEKDCMPLNTFQYGVFKFPYGVNNRDTLFFQPVATNKNDLALMRYNEETVIAESGI